MNKLKSRKLWVVVALIAPSVLSTLGIDINVFYAFLSDAQEKVALAASGGTMPTTDTLAYIVGAIYVFVQGQLDKKEVGDVVAIQQKES